AAVAPSSPPAITAPADAATPRQPALVPFESNQSSPVKSTPASRPPVPMRSWPRFAVSQRQIAAALLLLPSILTGAFASFIASRRDPPQPAPADVARVKPKPVITKPVDRDFAAILPK